MRLLVRRLRRADLEERPRHLRQHRVFHLTAAGQKLLARARGNQLAAHVTITDGSATASGDLVLVRYR